MKKIKIYQVDAFASELFKGNPAAVCPLNEWLDEKIMQNIAMENNLSETVFFIYKENKFFIRWFTPIKEIELAGHPTIAAAHIILNEIIPEKSSVKFHTKTGDTLKVSLKKNIYSLDLPSGKNLIKKTNLEMISMGLKSLPSKFLEGRYGLAIYDNEIDIINISPDFNMLMKLDYDGIIVTAPGRHFDFVSRFFGPKLGIFEDPVTGSAHCQLIPYWSKILKKKNMIARQLSIRGGQLNCTYDGDRVIIGGEAITYMQGEILL